MPSDREGWVVDGLDWNDEQAWQLERLSVPRPEPRVSWLDSPDFDGSIPAEEERWGNRVCTARIRAIDLDSPEEALASIQGIAMKLAKAARVEGGIPIEWTPAGTDLTGTLTLYRGQITNLPITWEGDDAGWFLDEPVLEVELTCAPIIEGALVELDPVAMSGPVGRLELPEIAGTARARATAVITETSSQSRRYAHISWGPMAGDDGDGLIRSDDLITTGLAGAQDTRSGALNGDVVKASLARETVAICQTPVQVSTGIRRVIARLRQSTAGQRFRVSYRVDDGDWTAMPYVSLPLTSSLCEVALGSISIPADASEWDARIEAFASGDEGDAEVDYVLNLPGANVAELSAPDRRETPTRFLLKDGIFEDSGAMTGQDLDIGGEWATQGGADWDTDDFEQNFGGIRRTAVSDSGRGRILVANAFTSSSDRVRYKRWIQVDQGGAAASDFRAMLVVNFTNSSNYVLAGFVIGDPTSIQGQMTYRYAVIKRVGGVETTIAIDRAARGRIADGIDRWLEFEALTDGRYRLWAYEQGQDPGEPVLEGLDSDMATGGAVEGGIQGMLDYWPGSGAATRIYSLPGLGGLAWEPVERAVLFSGRQLAYGEDAKDRGHGNADRQNAAGTKWGRVQRPRAFPLLLEPAGDEGQATELSVLLRRGDIAESPSTGISDGASVSIAYRPGYIDVPG